MISALVNTVVVIVIGVVLAIVVGRMLERVGRPFLDDVFQDARVSHSMARLLSVMFYLLALGSVIVVSTIDMPSWKWVWATALKLGIMVAVLVALNAAVVAILLLVKRHRRRQVLEEELERRLRPEG